MKNGILEDIKQKFIDICEENNICWTDALLYMIYSEYPIAVIDENNGDLNKIKDALKQEYYDLWDLQPAIEEDEDKAFLIQHQRDILDVLLGSY